MSFLPSEPPPTEDSEDLTDEEIESAVPTQGVEHLSKLIATELMPGHASVGKGDARFALKKHELRCRKPHLYSRVTMCCPGEPDKEILYQIDWLKRDQGYE